MKVTLKLYRDRFICLSSDISTAIENIDFLFEDNIERIYFRQEIGKFLAQLYLKSGHFRLNPKPLVLKLNSLKILLLWEIYGRLDDKFVTDITVRNYILSEIDKVNVSYIPYKIRFLDIEEGLKSTM